MGVFLKQVLTTGIVGLQRDSTARELRPVGDLPEVRGPLVEIGESGYGSKYIGDGKIGAHSPTKEHYAAIKALL